MPNLSRATAGAVITGAGYAAWLLCSWGGQSGIRAAEDLGLVGFPLVAAGSAGLAAHRTRGSERAAWISMAIGAGGWAAGAALWRYYDVAADLSPVPSWADAGYATFLVGAALCLFFLMSTYWPGTRVRLLLDGIIAAAALVGAAWMIVLNVVYAADPLPLGASLVYPVADIALITIAALILVRAPKAKRLELSLVTAGLMFIAASDSAFVCLAAVGGFYQHQLITIGWVWGFLAIGLAAVAVPAPSHGHPHAVAQVPSRTSTWLPYVPVLVSTAICTPMLIAGLGPVVVAAAMTVFAVMIRQFLVIGENRRLLIEVADQVLRDPLTGLANRTLFQDRLAHAVQLHQRHPLAVSVVVLNLDHFKLVNDSLGHSAGDAVLVRVSERLVGIARSGDTVARLGADEFALLMEGDTDASGMVAQRVVEAFDRPFVIDGQDLLVRPSVGLAIAAVHNVDVSAGEILRRAEVAMYSAKRSRSSQLVRFSPETDPGRCQGALLATSGTGGEREVGSARLLGELRHAIEHFGLSVVYQPKFHLSTDQIVGLEALIRWPHPRRGLLGPDQFLPLVRQHGLMASLTAVVLDLALDDVAKWYHKGVGVPVAINVFAPAISDPDFPGQIMRALDQRGLPPSALTVEITEDLLVDNMGRALLVFNKLRDKGIRVAIDDFGSGYSALWYLREFPVDEVKLAKEFIAPILTHPASAAIVRAVIDLAHALDVTPVAEGVENAETAALLAEYGCEVAQGFHYSAPLAPAAVLELLEMQKRLRGRGAMNLTARGAARSS
ncbi:MAG TPA: EAL domain-containing protein [Mycobacterium sp.]|nr:EAL domain-containing protein [Mycobacterium sp.]